ncbi:MAG: fumarylacetoacetate hydrolase family protein [Verrucomicrobiae bacterium]|nr:fumarylacetoacetate hydrolase family protein [Verrucomicrobiae bacterium]
MNSASHHRLARIRHAGNTLHVAVQDGAFRPIAGDIFGRWEPGDDTIPPDRAQLLAPVDPPQIICIGLNYRRHAAESNMAVPDAPVIFVKTANCIVAHAQPILLPAIAPDEVDYEAELAIVIGRTAKRIPESAAADHILGFTCANDVSARDCQLRLDKQWARGKCFDTFAPLGPWIATGIDGDNLSIRLSINGEVLQDSRTSDMIFHCAQLVSYVSHSMTLLPGSVILTGTPEGVGFGRKPQRFLRDGDTVSVEIEGIGTLTNPVTKE